MKNKTTILLILFVISIGANFYLFAQVQKLKKADEKQLEVFTRVANQLDSCRFKDGIIPMNQ